MSNLTVFFESEVAFKANLFSQQTFEDIRNYLQQNSVFKRNVMLELLVPETEYSLSQWLEWFNWYFQAFALDVPNWLTQKLITFSHDNTNFSVVTYQDLLNAKWTVQDVVTSSISLSASGIDSYHPNNNELEHWSRLRHKNLDLFIGMLLAGQLVAQVGFVMLDKSEFIQLRNGEITEDKIQGVKSEYSRDIYLYVPSVVIKKDFQKKYLLPVLLQHLLLQLKSNKAFFSRVKGFIALAYTEAGERLCSEFKLLPYPQTNSKDKVFVGTIEDFSNSNIVKKLESI